MTKYICKCGRVVAKSTSADNTGNRNTDGCEGCPYLLPWGPMVWDDRQKGYTQDVKGYECRMSSTLDYTTTYHGRADDKCSLHIVSLDLDFLDEVQAWIYDHANETLRADFSRGSMRGIEFYDKGRYSLSVLCAQNKKGVAAKAALLAEFFGPDKHRRDMTPEEEKAHILAAIEAGKTRAQRKENTMVYKDPSTGWMYRVSPKAGKDGCFCIEYIDPVSSAEWKPWPAEAKTKATISETIAEVLEARAKQNGWEPTEEKEWNKPKVAPSGAAAVTTGGSAAAKYGAPGEETKTMAAGASGVQPPRPLAQSAPRQTEHATDTAPAAPSAPAFDYSGLDDQTVADLHLAEREYAGGKKMAEMGLRRMADAVAIAHDALCVTIATKCRNGDGAFTASEKNFGRWCESVGLNRKAAERLLQVSKLMDGSTPREQKVLEELTPSVLYEASRPSAEPEAVEALKQQQVKTLKEYRELEARLKAEREAKEKAQQDAAQASKREEEARAAAHQYHVKYQEANDQRNRLLDEQGVYISRITEAEEKVKAAQAEVARQKRIGMEMQEEVESRDERIRELQQSQTVVAGTADPEEIERRAREIAQAKIAESDAKWSEIAENQGRQLAELRARSSGAVAVKSAHSSIESILDRLFQELHRDYDDACLAAMEDMNDYLFATWQDIHDLLHPEDVEDAPDFDDDDEEDGYDDET